jgi:hypothetical protein
VKCPACGGKKSRSAKLCASCRKLANEVGASLLPHVHQPPARPRTLDQNRAYHGKCGAIAKLKNVDAREIKKQARARASELFGRTIESSADLSELEMDRLLDRLDDELEQLLAARS